MCFNKLIQFSVVAAIMAPASFAQEREEGLGYGTLDASDVSVNTPDYSPFVDQHMPTNVYWGDTHLHTSYSIDGGFFGNTLDPGQAYRFARGEELVSSTGTRAKLNRPLDWLVVADHAEYFGLADLLATGDPVVYEDPVTERWYKMRQSGDPVARDGRGCIL